jgi:hypothetical protein
VKFQLRGLCDVASDSIDRDYILIRESLKSRESEFQGLAGLTKIVYRSLETNWHLVSTGGDAFGSALAVYNGTKQFPTGLQGWYHNGICGEDNNQTDFVELKFSKVNLIFLKYRKSLYFNKFQVYIYHFKIGRLGIDICCFFLSKFQVFDNVDR